MATKQERPVDSFERFALPLLLAFGLSVLVVYTLTLYPSVPGGDSGELIVAAYGLGVAHPPGYPLYTLCAKAATLIPAGTIAWRVNFLTALFGALAATLLARATWKLVRDPGSGLLAGGLFAFSPLAWRYSIGAEVFSLNHLFVALLLSLLIAFEREPKARTVHAYFFAFGLGLTNHQTLLFVGAPIGLWILFRARGLLSRPAGWIKAAACGAAGLLPYLYLIASSSRDPRVTWGGTSDVAGFVAHVLRKQYGTFRLGATDRESSLIDSLGAFFANLPRETLYVGVALAVVGAALPFVRRAELERSAARVVTVALAALAAYLVVFNTMTNLPLEDPLFHHIQSRFWQQADLIVCLLAGVGFAWLLRHALKRGAHVSLGIAAVVVVCQLGVNYGAEDRSGSRYVADEAADTLRALPRDALVVSKGDLHWNSLRYLQVCEGMRPDVRIVDIKLLEAPWVNELVKNGFPEVTVPGDVYRPPARSKTGSYDLKALFAANVSRFPVLTNATDHEGDQGWRQDHVAWPDGVFHRVHRRGRPVDLGHYAAVGERWIDAVSGGRPADIVTGSWEEVAWKSRLDSGTRLGSQLLNEVVTTGSHRQYLGQAGRLLEVAVGTGEPLEPSVYMNLGIFYFLRRDEDPGAVRKMVDTWETYLKLAPADAPQREMVREVLRDPAGADVNIGAF